MTTPAQESAINQAMSERIARRQGIELFFRIIRIRPSGHVAGSAEVQYALSPEEMHRGTRTKYVKVPSWRPGTSIFEPVVLNEIEENWTPD
jgi:hypothetical protein